MHLIVPTVGLEPTLLSEPVPKTGASAVPPRGDKYCPDRIRTKYVNLVRSTALHPGPRLPFSPLSIMNKQELNLYCDTDGAASANWAIVQTL